MRELVLRGLDVSVLLRTTSDRAALADLPVKLAFGDLSDPSSLKRAVSGIDLLFHVAADYRLWVPDAERMHDINVKGTIQLLQAAVEAGVQRIVYTSSAVTIRCPAERLGTEADFMLAGDCRSTYQRTKVLAEQAVRLLIGQGAPVVIVNPSTPIGMGDRRPTPTGRLVVDYLNGRLPAFVETALNWVSAEDVARGHWLAAGRGQIGERYILGHENLSLGQFFHILADVSGQPAPRVKIPYAVAYAAGAIGSAWGWISGKEPRAALEGVRMAARPMRYDSRKAIRELGLPQTPIRVAAAEAVRWFREQGYVTRGGVQ